MYVSYGVMVGEVFVEHSDEITKQKADPLHVHIEDGVHPLSPGTALRQCDTCGKWYALEVGVGEPCVVEGCAGTVLAYDAWTRLASLSVAGMLADVIGDTLY